MIVARAILAGSVAFQPASGAAAEEAHDPPMVMQFQWSLSCPANQVGADGQPLCSAQYVGSPNLQVSRTNGGMRLVTAADCGRAKNRLGQDVPAYRKIGIDVSLDPGVSPQRIQRLIMLNLKDFPHLLRKACPSSFNSGKFDLEEWHLPAMINSIFVIKQVRY